MQKEPELDAQGTSALKQRRKMLLALALMLTALVVVLIKDRHLWFGSGEDSTESQVEEATSLSSNPSAPTPLFPSQPAAKAKKSVKHATPAPQKPEATEPGVVTERKALPPLSVEVVTNDKHKQLHPASNALKIEMQSGSAPASVASEKATASKPPVSNAADRVRMPSEVAESSATASEPSYPLLAKQMRIQGSVVLQALIGSDGFIQDLRVLSGPGILASAAREAVRQWHFKPYLQNGQPAETQAKITVNFIISTS